jgi:glycosyltransferase involved in cell wall biosynthesis
MGGMVTGPAWAAADPQNHLRLVGAEAEPAVQPTLGVVIPVRNGARTLGAVLDALAAQTSPGRLHIVIVINGSRDDTGAVSERHALRLRAAGHTCEVHLTAPGRAGAIRLAEDRLAPGNRLYIDCDAILSDNAVQALERALQPGSNVHFATPRLIVGPSSSRITRAYFRAWSRLPYVRESPVTYGVYAVSEEGRRRWSELPLIHSDDKFVRLHFDPAERRELSEAWYEIVPPHGWRRLLRTRRRYLAGNGELARGYPELVRRDRRRCSGAVSALLRNPRTWPSSAVFLTVYGTALALERWSR